MSVGSSLGDQLTQKVSELKQVISGISDDQASKAQAEGGWCAKEVLSHLIGDEHSAIVERFKRFVEEDTPTIEVVRGVSAFDARRQQTPVPQLMETVESRYRTLAEFLSGLSDDQLGRKAHVPLLKESPLGEYPTLGQWAGFVINFHLTDHINQLRSLTA